ncbi:MAG TPA: BON domain-containing protein [Chloroflexota bacterium]
MAFCPECADLRPGRFPPMGHRTYYALGPYWQRLYQPGGRSDEEIKRDVEDILFYDTWVPAHSIRVDVKDGRVTLTGTVSTSTEKRAAGEDAWDVIGVVDVVNNLQIAPGGEQPAKVVPQQQI